MSSIPFRKYDVNISPDNNNGWVLTAHPVGNPNSAIMLGRAVSQRMAIQWQSAITDELVEDAARTLLAPVVAEAKNANMIGAHYGVVPFITLTPGPLFAGVGEPPAAEPECAIQGG